MAWKEYCAEYWLKELQDSMDRCTDHRNIIEILLKNYVKHHTINQSVFSVQQLLALSQISPCFYMSEVHVFKKHCGKMRNCSLQAISHFSSFFYPFGELFAIFIKFEGPTWLSGKVFDS